MEAWPRTELAEETMIPNSHQHDFLGAAEEITRP